MKKVVRNEAYQAFLDAAQTLDLGTRIKDVRDQPLRPGGRVIATLFERVNGGRPHPRIRFAFAEVEDPGPSIASFEPASPPTSAAGLREAIASALTLHADVLATRDLDPKSAPPDSPCYWRNRIRVLRTAALFTQVRSRVEAWLGSGTLPASERAGCYRAVTELEEEAYAGTVEFDDADTGTYHSFGHDAPFVHYLEQLLSSLPAEGSEDMALLHSANRESVRRQHQQTRAHLDWLMRKKYAYHGIEETDIERSLGGFLIDAESRRIVSEVPDSDPLAPHYELLRIAPTANHSHAGAWVYRDAAGGLRLQDHQPLEVEPELLRSAPREPEQLTFRRAPDDPHLRKGIRFDWDEGGFVQQGAIDWVSWAGHCDVKAVLELLGLTLTGDPPPRVEEYRADTGRTTIYDRELLLEMLASVLELGSSYSRLDGTGQRRRGFRRFGGSRNDSRPDRLQFTGPGRGKGFRWPMGSRRELMHVTAIELPDGQRPDMGTAFFRHLPELETVSFAKNPRYVTTVEGDYNVIDVSGARIEAKIKVDAFDPHTGYPVQRDQTTVIDLRPGADPGPEGRYFLGTHMDDAASRKLLRVYYDPAGNRIVAEMDRYTQRGDTWVASRVPSEDIEVPLQSPLRCTLSREMKRDDPSQFTALLHLALRQAHNICADTDQASAVWNGVVTRLRVTKTGANPEARTERWQVDVKARFGEATLDYLVRRDERGQPQAYCPATSDHHWGRWPDFLWHDVPDVGSKGVENGDWVVNDTMVDRELVTIRVDESVPSGFYVFDDHIKNVFELLFCGLAGYTHTVVHNDKRHGFRSVEAWNAATRALDRLRAAVSFVDGPSPASSDE
ncbi:hypothetical protein [Paraliomyxa miuraensis]|uniref:hypothetical protein n=1 Tax=Paraliomyxa miuraensis TaxID=376150 RepID=UPI00225A0079|nr:hypothetical protein [Paraliomyxa miuraensis]MCX4241484.1 hypothetical protein [Paraliomyxa miuraensis]